MGFLLRFRKSDPFQEPALLRGPTLLQGPATLPSEAGSAFGSSALLAKTGLYIPEKANHEGAIGKSVIPSPVPQYQSQNPQKH